MSFSLSDAKWTVADYRRTAFKHNGKHGNCDTGDTLCLDVGERPILSNIRTGLIDPDTPESVMTKKAADGKDWKLVVSLRLDEGLGEGTDMLVLGRI